MARKAISMYDGDVRIWFEQRNHLYTHDNGDIIANPSSVLKLVNKPFLVPYAAKKATESMELSFQPYTQYDVVQIGQMLRAAKRAHKEYSADRMLIGSQIHAYCEQRIRFELGLRKTKKALPPSEGLPEVRKGAEAFEEFVWRYSPTWHFAERVVYSRASDHVGTVDAACDIDGKTYVVDWKTGAGLYPEHAWQMASYWGALVEEEPDEYEHAERLLVRLSTDSGKFKPYMEADIQERLTGGSAAQDYAQFLRLLESWRYTQAGPQGWVFR